MTYQNIEDSIEDNDDIVSSELTPPEGTIFKEPVVEPEPRTWLGGPQGLLIGLVLGLGLAFLGGRIAARRVSESGAIAPADTEQVASATITTARAQSVPVRQTITTNGTVEAFDLLSVAPRAGVCKFSQSMCEKVTLYRQVRY